MPDTHDVHRDEITIRALLDHWVQTTRNGESGGMMPSGKQVESWVRATFCFRKAADEWRVAHQHISMPLRLSSGAS